jgi:hypothetical protein
MSTSFLRCPACKCECMDGNIKHEDYLAISLCCDEPVERVWLCTKCGQGEQHKGCEECRECLIASIVADPRELDMCTRELRDEICRELATRYGALTRRQAA